jgi:6-phosphofructokinase 1
MITHAELAVRTLGEPNHRSPLPMSRMQSDGLPDFVPEDVRVLVETRVRAGRPPSDLAFELAGPRERLFFDPSRARAAIVTCGGLCPGINNVIRTLYFELTDNYGVREILGIRFGYQGLNPEAGTPPIVLSGNIVEEIHHLGGTILGTSRGAQEPAVMVDFLQSHDVDILFCVGGDGTQRGAHAIACEIERRKLAVAVVGLPKTIDNDIKFCTQTFGFATAVAEADTVID